MSIGCQCLGGFASARSAQNRAPAGSFFTHATSIEQHGKDMRRFRMPQLCGLPQRLLGLSP